MVISKSVEFIYNFMNLKSVQEKQKVFKTFTADQKELFMKEKSRIYYEVNRDILNAQSRVRSKLYYEKNRDEINKRRRESYRLKQEVFCQLYLNYNYFWLLARRI